MVSETIRLRVDESAYCEVEVTRLGTATFRLESTPLLAIEPVYAGDVIEAAQTTDGTLQFVRVVERASMRHYAWVVPKAWVSSAGRAAYLEAVKAAGGQCEQQFGGLLHVHVPADSAFDAEGELDRHLKSEWPEA